MANLKGGSFEKQIKDAFHRLEAFGVGRVDKNDNLTHSDKLAEKREMYLKDISDYFTSCWDAKNLATECIHTWPADAL